MGSDRTAARPGADAVGPRAVALFGSFRHGQYYEDIVAGVVAGADAAGAGVIVVQASPGVMPSGFEVDARAVVSRAAWDHFDAAIVIVAAVSREYVAALRAAGKFVVAIGQELRGAHAVVAIDNAGGVSDAVSHLAGHGHRAIGFLGPIWQADTAERYAAYCRQMGQLGLGALPLMGREVTAEVSMDEQGYLAAQQFPVDDRLCTAVVVGTDLIALGFIRGLQERGVDVPGDLAVVGIDDVDEASVSVPTLATVAISFQRVGQIAFDVALRGGRGEAMDDRYLVPQRFVPRESCGCAAASTETPAHDAGTPVDVFREALLEAAQEGVLGTVDACEVTRVAYDVARLLGRLPHGGGRDRPDVGDVAAAVMALCVLDRSVQAALRAIRVLAKALADGDEADPGAWSVSSATLDLFDALRSGQLQRRMTEYVNLKRMQASHYFIGNSLLGSDRDELRSLGWLRQTHAQAGALGLWHPPGQTDRIAAEGVYERAATGRAADPLAGAGTAIESFPPAWMLRDAGGRGRLLVLAQVMFEDSDWGVLAVAGGRVLQSSLLQETFQQWATLMSVSLDQERADHDLARQAGELTAAYETEMALLDEVRISEERYALAAEAAHDALWDWDIATGKVFYSSSWKALLGHRDGEIGATPDEWLGRVHEDDAVLVREQLDHALNGVEQYLEFEHRLRVSTGEYRWIACSGRSVVDGDGRPVRVVGSITDVTVRRLLQDQLLQEALFDGLTGLAKSTLFKDRLTQAIELAKRRPDYWFAVLFVDLDGFKAVNDNLGHAAGDELLASVASRLKESLRSNDTAARLGGDEFAILLTDIGSVGELPLIIRRIRSLICAPHQVGGQTASVGAAIGVAVSGAGYPTADAMLHEADMAMYRAKRRSQGADV